MKTLACCRTMLEIDKAGDGIRGLCATKYILPGDKTPGDMTEAAGECTEISAGEPRSEIVWHPTADGVALAHQQRRVVWLALTYMLLD
jgi:hypothetical protein